MKEETAHSWGRAGLKGSHRATSLRAPPAMARQLGAEGWQTRKLKSKSEPCHTRHSKLPQGFGFGVIGKTLASSEHKSGAISIKI